MSSPPPPSSERLSYRKAHKTGPVGAVGALHKLSPVEVNLESLWIRPTAPTGTGDRGWTASAPFKGRTLRPIRTTT